MWCAIFSRLVKNVHGDCFNDWLNQCVGKTSYNLLLTIFWIYTVYISKFLSQQFLFQYIIILPLVVKSISEPIL